MAAGRPETMRGVCTVSSAGGRRLRSDARYKARHYRAAVERHCRDVTAWRRARATWVVEDYRVPRGRELCGRPRRRLICGCMRVRRRLFSRRDLVGLCALTSSSASTRKMRRIAEKQTARSRTVKGAPETERHVQRPAQTLHASSRRHNVNVLNVLSHR